MSIPKLKKETYNCQGGINLKISQYLAKEGEFLAIQNFDFRTVGALSSAMGSTRYCSTNIPTIRGIGIFNSPLGTSFATQISATFSIVTGGDANIFAVTPSSRATLMTNTFNFLSASTHAAFFFAFGASSLFGSDGWNFFNYQGSTVAWNYGLPKPITNALGSTAYGAGTGGISGTAVMYFSIVRKDGLIGPSAAFTATVTGNSGLLFDLPKVNTAFQGDGFTNAGYSGIQAWVALNGGPALGFSTLFGWSGTLLGLTLSFNYTAIGWAMTTPQPYDYQGTYYYGLGAGQGSDAGVSSIIGQNSPIILEYFYNQLFMANFGLRPNRVIFSNPGTPEVSDYQNYFDVGDATALTAMKKFYTELALFKFAETWALTGSSPDTFVLSQVHPQIGCISKGAVCLWNQYLWFLDARGIYQFDGSNVICTSNKVEDLFLRMNVSAAAKTALMFHIKERNEIWTCIPIDGATKNNICIVYDYMAQGWYTRTPPAGPYNGTLDNAAVATLGQDRSMVFFTQFNNNILMNFGASLSNDYGDPSFIGVSPGIIGFTAVMKSRFVEGDLGNSVTKLWRRLYVDAAVASGQTFVLGVNFYADKSTIPALQTTMAISSYQNRIDFGIPAKSLAVELIYSGAAGVTAGVGQTFLQLNGFTLEYRFQRAT